MRDYIFGNYISGLRERGGLSQYQLGVLVGVSDKAVSKWENGVSKPRIDTIIKLAEVFDVSVNELLTCEYDVFDRERKDLLTMKNEILKKAKCKLRELYGDNPPISIVNRFEQEKLMLNGQDMLLWMGFFGKLQEQFDEQNMYFDFRGAQMGASFIAWLLNDMGVNPLPTHYYCPICKKVEFVPDVNCGIDLPNKQCSCGEDYRKDGFGVDAMNMYPLLKHHEIYVSSQATEIVKKCLYEYFEDKGLVREIHLVPDETPLPFDNRCTLKRFAILTNEMNSRFSDDVIKLSMEEYFELFDETLMLTIIENKDEYLSSWDVRNVEFTQSQLKEYCDYALEKGIFNDCERNVNMEMVLAEIKQPKFSDLISLFGFLHGTGTWNENAETLYKAGIPINELISCREDVYAYLYNKLNGTCCDNPSGQVFAIKESVRKGRYSYKSMPSEIKVLLSECGVPEWYVESMEKILYLFPKTHIITILKREICRCVKENS